MQTTEVRDSILEVVRKNIGYFLSTGLALVISIVFAYVANLYIPGSCILIFFFLIIPILSLMILNITQLRVGKPLSLKDFYKGYRVTLIPGLHGSYRVIRSIIFAILISLLTFMFVYSATSLFTSVVDPVLVDELQKAQTMEEWARILNDFYTSPTSEHYLAMYGIFELVSFGVGEFFFIHFVLKSVPLFYIQSSMACSKKDAIFLYNQVYPTQRKTYRKTIFKVCGIYYVLFPVGYILGGILGWFVFKDGIYATIFALLFSLLFSIPILPMYLLCQDYLFVVYAPVYKKSAKSLYEKALANLDADERMSEEQKTVIRQFYETQLKEIEKMEKVEIITQLSPNEMAERDFKEKEDEAKKPHSSDDDDKKE